MASAAFLRRGTRPQSQGFSLVAPWRATTHRLITEHFISYYYEYLHFSIFSAFFFFPLVCLPATLEAELPTYSLGPIFLNRNFSATRSPLFHLPALLFSCFFTCPASSVWKKSHQHVEDLPKHTTKLLNTQAIKGRFDYYYFF